VFHGGVRKTSELARITALPRRDPASPEWDALVEDLSTLLRRPGSSATLRRVQALALHDIGVHGGGVCAVEVGGGKTLTSLLAPYVLGAVRPLLLLPAGLVKKTEDDRADLARDWLIPTNIRLFSYEMLGTKQAAAELDIYEPDLIVADEAHFLKNLTAARTKRVARYMAAHSSTAFVALTGTMMSRSLLEFGHILRWALKAGVPVPATESELEEWDAAINEKVEEIERYDAGALLDLADAMGVPPGGEDVTRARQGLQRRLVETPGIVTSSGNDADQRVAASIYVRAVTYDLAPETDAHFEALRADMIMPDGRELFEPIEVWQHARQLALGLLYVWNPWPRDDWRLARKEWHSYVRNVLARSDRLDSPAQVEEAVLAGKLPSGRAILDAWRTIAPTFTPNVEPRWHDEGALKKCLEWMKEPGLVWTEHSFFARRLAALAKTKYYGRKGFAADGEALRYAPTDRAIVVSADANRAGHNLQHWARNLIVSPVEISEYWQQLIGRTHRSGQKADVVEVDVFLGCLEHVKAWRGARAGAKAVRETTGAEQKLLLADVVSWPSDDQIARWRGARWKAPKRKDFVIPLAA
jgi:hypothetical protein